MCLAVQTIQGLPGEEKARKKARGKVKADPKGPEEHPLAKKKHKILNGGQKRTLLGGLKDRRARKACQKAMMAFSRVVFALTSQIKAQARMIPRTTAKERTKKGKARKELILNLDCQPLKNPIRKNMAMPGNRTTGLPAVGLTNPGIQLRCGFARKLILHGWWHPL